MIVNTISTYENLSEMSSYWDRSYTEYSNSYMTTIPANLFYGMSISTAVPSEPLYYNGVVGELARVWNYENNDLTQSEFIDSVDYPSPDDVVNGYRGMTSLPVVTDSSYATHLTFRVTTSSSFYLGFFGATTSSFPGPHVYVSTAYPEDPTSVGTLLYKSPNDMVAAGGFTARVGIASGNYGKFVTFVTSGFGSVSTWIRNKAEIEGSSVYLVGTFMNT